MPERETIAAAVEPVLASLGLDLFDLQLTGSGRAPAVRVVVDRDGGVDLDTISSASERISDALDARDDLGGPYALEVSSPGLERPLHRPDHFRRAVGETVSVKVRGDGESRRLRGELVDADEHAITVDIGATGTTERIDYDEIVQARTVFEWGTPSKPRKRAKKKEVAR